MNSITQENLNEVTLEKELLDIWRRALKNENLTVDDDFFECGGDSLLAIQVLLEIEQLTGKSLSKSIIFETGTVRILSNAMMSKNITKPTVSVLIGSANAKIIHFFHSHIELGGWSVKIFSKMLGHDYLIHVIAPHLPHEGNMPDSIEDMAKERLQKVLETQPDGPYVLIGHCKGALVAFEVARQLVSMGKEVKSVVMIDPAIMSVRKSAQFIYRTADFFMRLMGFHKSRRNNHLIWIWRKLTGIDALTKDSWRRALSFCRETWPQKRISLKKFLEYYSGSLFQNKLYPISEERKDIEQHYRNAFFSYNPLPLDVPMLYISLEFHGKAWRRICRSTVYMNICDGEHNSWREDYSQDMVNKIRDFIKR
jgi:oxalate---CoA ligase